MSRIRVALVVVVLLIVAGLILVWIVQSRATRDRIACQNHLRELGLFGVRHATTPGHALPVGPRDELPPGTFQNPALPPAERMSWYTYTLAALVRETPAGGPGAAARRPEKLAELVRQMNLDAAWDAENNLPLARYRLAVAICPAQVRDYPPDAPVPTNYIAVGGLGVETPSRTLEAAGPVAGCYRYGSPTPNAAIKDGLQQTAQIVESTSDLGPWLRGGPSTVRGLDVSATPYLGPRRPFGGCHPDGVTVSMADGSVRFVKETINPAVFRAMFTIAGGPDEVNFDAP